MALDNSLALLVACFRVVVVLADEVGRKAAIVIHIGLAIGHVRFAPRNHFRPGRQVAEQQLIQLRVVIVWLGPGKLVVDAVGEAHTKTIGLHSAITASFLTRPIRIDSRQ